MRIGKFFISSLPVIILIYILDHPLGPIPPAGKFLNPVQGFMANAESDKTNQNDNIFLSNAQIHGSVYFDERLVPHIYADDAYSLYFLQGYVTAKYRLWQMETQTRAAAGRLSEILGKDLLNYDREQRRIGMGYAAENALKELEKDEELYNCITAYTAGVNELIQSLDYASYPLEYKLLNYKPELWAPIKTMYLLKYMANTLSGYDDDVAYTNNLKMLGRKDFDILFPDRPTGIVPIIASEKKYDFNPLSLGNFKIDSVAAYYSTSYDETISHKEKNEVGSNNWVVGKQKTKNGNVILCNDPHLQLNLPSIWYEVQLHSPQVNVYGASLPGAPAVVIGFNENIAWGVTNAGWDVRDWYAIEFKDETKKEYKYADGWKETSQRIETIKIKGEKDFVDTVLYTHHGPLVFNGGHVAEDAIEKHKSQENLSMRWSALDSSIDMKAFYLLNSAKNYDDYRNALSYFSCPAQNFIFGCKTGDIAITQQGKFAKKYDEQGRFILDGSNPADEWNTYIPSDQNPTIKNPEQNYLTSANQHPTDSTYPYYYTGFDFEFFRNVVLNNELQKMNSITTDDMKKLQTNNFNKLAHDILPIFLSNVNSSKTVYSDLQEWNYFNDADSENPTYFQIWWDTLYNLLWDEFQKDDIVMRSPGKYETMLAIKNLSNDYFMFDDARTKDKKETLSDIINESYTAMLSIVDSIKNLDKNLLKWYEHKSTDIMHIAQIPAFSKMNIHNGGYRNIVNATSETHGGSWRMVVELADTINAYGIYPGGQSGNPGSKYYDNFIDDWAEGNNYKLHFYDSNQEAEKNSKFIITFN